MPDGEQRRHQIHNHSSVFILDHKLLEDAVHDPEHSPCTEILSSAFFCKKLHKCYVLNITRESLDDLAKNFSSPDGEEITIIDEQQVKLKPAYSKPIVTIVASCHVEEKLNKQEITITDATLELISKRKIDAQQVYVISQGHTLLTSKIAEKGIKVEIINCVDASTKLHEIFSQPDSTF